MTITASALLIGAVLVGGALQRVAGMGFAMVVAPFAVLLLQGQQGVVFANVCGALAGLLLVWPVRHDIDRRRLGLLVVASLVGAALGALIVGPLDVAAFRIVVGSVLVVAIACSLLVGRLRYAAPVTSSSIVAGGVTGMLVTMSGIGGPPMSIYAVVTKWEHRAFAATMQPFVVVSSIFGASAVLLASPNAIPALNPATWVAVVVALVIGLGLGQLGNRYVSARAGRAVVVALGLVGAVTAIVSGISAL